MLKVLYIFCVLQSCLIAYLFFQNVALNRSLVNASNNGAFDAAAVPSLETNNKLADTPTRFEFADENRLRTLLREELQKFEKLRNDTLSPSLHNSETQQAPIKQADYATQNLRMLTQVNEQLSAYIDEGKINGQQLDELNQRIAQLLPEQRHQAMQRLARSINSKALSLQN
jgi:hypothetical protein